MITNRVELATTLHRSVALDSIEAGIAAADPETVVRERIEGNGQSLIVDGTTYKLDEFDRVIVLGAGNAAGHLATALEGVLGERIDDGIVVTDNPVQAETIDVRRGDHPIPSQRGLEHTAALLELAEEATEDDLVLALIGGGGSALLVAPADGLTLSDLQETTKAGLASGATITELNAIRKHCSTVKGGQLARTIAPAKTVGLVMSDVIGDDLSVVASGPTVSDDSTYADALDVLDRYDINVPQAVRDRLKRGRRGVEPETPSAGDPEFDQVAMHVLTTGYVALEAAANVARNHGFEPLILAAGIRGEAREAAKTHVAIAEQVLETGQPIEPPAVLLTGGETTVTLCDDSGDGGSNQEFGLSAALEIAAERITVASVDTDGIDGASEVAGALVDTDTIPDRLSRPAAQEALRRNDALPVLDQAGDLIRTGPTTTNVNDLRVIVVDDGSYSKDRSELS